MITPILANSLVKNGEMVGRPCATPRHVVPGELDRQQAPEQAVVTAVLFPGEQQLGQLGLDLLGHLAANSVLLLFGRYPSLVTGQVDGVAKAQVHLLPLNEAAGFLHGQEGGVVSLIAVVQMLLLLLLLLPMEVEAGIAKLLRSLLDVAMTLRPAGAIASA